MADTGVVNGGPGGGADVPPEFFFGGEGVHVGRCARRGGESGAVKSGEDVGLDDVGMDVRDRRATTLIGGCERRCGG